MAVLTNISVKNYWYMFDFEKEFQNEETIDWMTQNWTLSIYYSILYIVIIFGTKYYMQDKPRFTLKPLLALWNLGLAAFSIMAFLRTAPELVYVISNHSFYYSVCVPSFVTLDRVSGYWSWLTALSKVVELGDTVFIVLRKQPLIFLHWYHHIATMLAVWYTFKETLPTGRWFMIMNLLIHFFMYLYYALKSMGFTPPRQMPILITTMQILQMMIGCGINIYVYNLLNNSVACEISYESIHLILALYVSYLILFANFFYQSYIAGKKIAKANHNYNNNLYKSKAKAQ